MDAVVVISFAVLLLVMAGVAWRQYQWWKAEALLDENANRLADVVWTVQHPVLKCPLCQDWHSNVEWCPAEPDVYGGTGEG